MERYYAAIDLKSFFASVECVERGLDPLDTNLVVADDSRTEKTICLAVSPALKAYGIPGRARLFEVYEQVRRVNAKRRRQCGKEQFTGESISASALSKHPDWELSFLTAPPRMALYSEYSSRIYRIYLRHIAPEDIHVYSIDEVFIDLTRYLKTYEVTPEQLVRRLIADVFRETGITATAGIGTNLYLAKIAMDMMAKRMKPDQNGVRMAFLDETEYRRALWGHTPLTDFWRIGGGYAKKLQANGMYTMGDVARFSLTETGEERLYRLFGVNAELLIDHAWGYEPCTMEDIKAYRPRNRSISSGQVLQEASDAKRTRIIVREMGEMLALELVEKKLVTDQLVLNVGYDTENLREGASNSTYRGEIVLDRYGRKIPKHAHGSARLPQFTSSARLIGETLCGLYDKIIDPKLLVRRITLEANHILPEEEKPSYQVDLFAGEEQVLQEDESLKKEKKMQEAILAMKKKYGKNAVLKGIHYEKGATGRERNRQIGGHKA